MAAKVSLFYYEATRTENGVTTEILALTCPACGAKVRQGVRHTCGSNNGKPAAARKPRTTAKRGAR